MKVRRRVASRLREWAEKLDYAGAPKRTSWCMTIEDGWGAVFNDRGVGCPLWYYGDEDYQLAHADRSVPKGVDEIEWITAGFHDAEGVVVLGSAEVSSARLSRRKAGIVNIVGVPGARRPAHIEQWIITLQCELSSFVQVMNTDYSAALQRMFQRGGIRG